MKVRGKHHITKSSTECLCGVAYRYGAETSYDRSTVVTAPLRWLELGDVDCAECREEALGNVE